MSPDEEPNAGLAIGFWVLWMFLLFITLLVVAGSLAGLEALFDSEPTWETWWLVGATALTDIALIVAVVQSARYGFSQQGRGRIGSGRTWFYLAALPLIVVFLWFGSCVVLMSGG